MLTVVILIAFLSMVSVALIDLVSSESTRSNSARTSNAAFQAAEAGLDDYLVEARRRQDLLPPPRPSRRVDAPVPRSGADVDPLPTGVTCNATKTGALGVDWTGTAIWDPNIANGKDNWCQLANGYEYNLQVTPPSATNENIQIVSTGRKICSPAYSPSSSCAPGTSTTQWRAVQEWVHWSLLSDFQMITERRLQRRRRTATTNGKIYAGRDSSGNNPTSTTRAPRQPTSMPKGRSPDLPACRTEPRSTARHDSEHSLAAPAPINFSNFTSPLDDLKTAAISGGEYFDASYPHLEVRAARERKLHRSGLHAHRG